MDDFVVLSGQARITFQTESEDRDAVGLIDRTLYFKLLSDASSMAAGSLVEDRFVLAETFDLYVTRSVTGGQLVALARVVSNRSGLLTVEAVLTDDQGRKVAGAHGVFSRAPIALPAVAFSDDEPSADENLGTDSLWDSPLGPVHLN